MVYYENSGLGVMIMVASELGFLFLVIVFFIFFFPLFLPLELID